MSRPTDLPPVILLLQEIQAITSSMRRNQRWASTSTSSFTSSIAPLTPSLQTARVGRKVSQSNGSGRRGRTSGEGAEEGDLMVGFVGLRRSLAGVRGVRPNQIQTVRADVSRYHHDPRTRTREPLPRTHSITPYFRTYYIPRPNLLTLPNPLSTTPLSPTTTTNRCHSLHTLANRSRTHHLRLIPMSIPILLTTARRARPPASPPSHRSPSHPATFIFLFFLFKDGEYDARSYGRRKCL